jgi:hypothetical protein
VTDISRPSEYAAKTRWIDWIAALGMTGVLLWPAFWNGFPLIFPDTGGYLLRPLGGTVGYGARFLAARQQHDQPDISAINVIHVPIAAVSLGVIAFFAIFKQPKWIDPALRTLCATVLLALLGNAVICGVLSNPNDRYQNRLIWLAVLAAAIVAAEWRRSRTGSADS